MRKNETVSLQIQQSRYKTKCYDIFCHSILFYLLFYLLLVFSLNAFNCSLTFSNAVVIVSSIILTSGLSLSFLFVNYFRNSSISLSKFSICSVETYCSFLYLATCKIISVETPYRIDNLTIISAGASLVPFS